MPDVTVENHGSVFTFQAHSEIARDWIDENVGGTMVWIGDSLAVEPRYAWDLAQGMISDGLEVA